MCVCVLKGAQNAQIVNDYTKFYTAQSVVWWTTGWTDQVRFPGGSRIFSSPQRSDRLWGPPSPLSSEYMDGFPGINLPGCQADHSPPSSAKVNNGGAIPPFPLMCSWHNVYLIKQRQNFTWLHRVSKEKYINIHLSRAPVKSNLSHEETHHHCFKCLRHFCMANVKKN
jgi:hypothetical protein